jgi:hypothetical protein
MLPTDENKISNQLFMTTIKVRGKKEYSDGETAWKEKESIEGQ